eukprot:GHVL01025827.1.p1 GENE.GHVL01025827.1~~GHVL01025827.1.p1  ORF type:complete len:973 (+),score=185.24 GHVL01025827.1:1446-4364(+)
MDEIRQICIFVKNKNIKTKTIQDVIEAVKKRDKIMMARIICEECELPASILNLYFYTTSFGEELWKVLINVLKMHSQIMESSLIKILFIWSFLGWISSKKKFIISYLIEYIKYQSKNDKDKCIQAFKIACSICQECLSNPSKWISIMTNKSSDNKFTRHFAVEALSAIKNLLVTDYDVPESLVLKNTVLANLPGLAVDICSSAALLKQLLVSDLLPLITPLRMGDRFIAVLDRFDTDLVKLELIMLYNIQFLWRKSSVIKNDLKNIIFKVSQTTPEIDRLYMLLSLCNALGHLSPYCLTDEIYANCRKHPVTALIAASTPHGASTRIFSSKIIGYYGFETLEKEIFQIPDAVLIQFQSQCDHLGEAIHGSLEKNLKKYITEYKAFLTPSLVSAVSYETFAPMILEDIKYNFENKSIECWFFDNFQKIEKNVSKPIESSLILLKEICDSWSNQWNVDYNKNQHSIDKNNFQLNDNFTKTSTFYALVIEAWIKSAIHVCEIPFVKSFMVQSNIWLTLTTPILYPVTVISNKTNDKSIFFQICIMIISSILAENYTPFNENEKDLYKKWLNALVMAPWPETWRYLTSKVQYAGMLASLSHALRIACPAIINSPTLSLTYDWEDPSDDPSTREWFQNIFYSNKVTRNERPDAFLCNMKPEKIFQMIKNRYYGHFLIFLMNSYQPPMTSFKMTNQQHLADEITNEIQNIFQFEFSNETFIDWCKRLTCLHTSFEIDSNDETMFFLNFFEVSLEIETSSAMIAIGDLFKVFQENPQNSVVDELSSFADSLLVKSPLSWPLILIQDLNKEKKENFNEFLSESISRMKSILSLFPIFSELLNSIPFLLEYSRGHNHWRPFWLPFPETCENCLKNQILYILANVIKKYPSAHMLSEDVNPRDASNFLIDNIASSLMSIQLNESSNFCNFFNNLKIATDLADLFPTEESSKTFKDLVMNEELIGSVEGYFTEYRGHFNSKIT